MRIAFFTDTFPPEVNGVAHTAERAARMLAKHGHVVRIFTVSKSSQQELQSKAGNDYSVETLPSLGLPIYLGVRTTMPVGLALRKVSRFKPDILHSHTPFSVGWEAVWAARFLHVPLVGTHHTFFNHYLKHVHLDYAWAERLSWKLTVGYYNRCDVVVSPTRSLIDELKANGLKSPYEIVPNSVDTEIYCPAQDQKSLRAKLNLPNRVVVHMGRLSYEKSIDQAIRAFKTVVEQEPSAMFVIVGDGPGKRDLEALVHELGLEKNVRFTGFVYGQRLVEYLQAADVFVTASKSENMPLAVLEAMAVGLPVIAVHSLGLAEMVEDEKSGYLLPPDDVPALAEHTLKLLRESGLQHTFSERSHSLGKSYSEPAIAERFDTLYTRVVAEHSKV
jgi:glycosyltransferase involved in cell wall biosynthesis